MATSAQTVSGNALELNSMRKERSLWGDAWRRLSRNRAAVAGIVVIIFFTLVAIFAPLIAPHNPTTQTSNNSLRLPAWVHSADPKRTGSPANVLGTDAIGRDLLSQLIYGARVSLIVGLIPQVLILLIGVTIGLVAGFVGGRTDNLLMRFTDIIYAFPDTLFVITLATAFRETWLGRTFNGLLLVFVALSII